MALTTQSKLRIGAEIVIGLVIIGILYVQFDRGYDAAIDAFCFRIPLQIILTILVVVRIISLVRKHPFSLRVFILKFVYMLILFAFLAASLLLPNEINYSHEIIYFSINRKWFEQIALTAPSLSGCSISTETACEETIALPEEYQFDNHKVRVAKDGKNNIVVIIDSSRIFYYVHVSGQTGLPSLGLGFYKDVDCYYRLSESWFVCGIGYS